MSVQGNCSIIKIVDNKIVVELINYCLLSSSNWDNSEYKFIGNVNFHKTSHDLKGTLIGIKYKDRWQLGMVMKMKYSGVSFYVIENYLLFTPNKDIMQEQDINLILQRYFGELITVSLQTF